jgi:soluble lytic murein transglycosylase-like protein
MRRLFVVPMLFLIVLAPTAAVATAGIPTVTPAQPVAEGAPPADFGEARAERRQAEARVERRERRERRSRVKAKAPAVSPALQAIASCESGGNPRAVSSNGMYRGKYQFSTATWAGVGGKGDPAAASEAEQDRRAAMLYARSGPGQWPVCGS